MEKEAGFWSCTGNTFEVNFVLRPNISRAGPAELLKFRVVPIYSRAHVTIQCRNE